MNSYSFSEAIGRLVYTKAGKMRAGLSLLLMALNFLAYRVNPKFHACEDPDAFSVDYGYRPRWYLPFYWVWVLVHLPFALCVGGVVAWVGKILDDFHEARWRTRSGTWKETATPWDRRWGMFQLFYRY